MSFSTADFIAMQSRLQKNLRSSVKAVEGQRDEPESKLHNDIINHCRQVGWIYFHGSMAKATSRTSGEPDFTILANKGRVFFIECKTRLGKLSPEQMGIKMWAEKLGHTIHVVRSFQEFVDVVLHE